VDRDPGLSAAERRAVKAMHWVASLADRKGLTVAMARLAAADRAFAKAETAVEADPAAALKHALEAARLDPQSLKKAELAGQ